MDRNIIAFLSIAEYGKLTFAAEAIGLTQPSLTKRLQNLEGKLGSQLFYRTRSGMQLTPAGKKFLPRARRIEQEVLQAKEELRSLEYAGLDIMRIGAGPLFHQRFVAPVFAKLLQEFPALRLDLSVDPNETSLPKLIAGDLDLVLGVIEPTLAQDDILILLKMTKLEHGIILPSDYKIANQTDVPAEALRDMRWVLYGDDQDTEKWLNDYFRENNLGRPQIAVQTASFNTGLSLVRSSGFVMMAPVQLAPVIKEAGLVIRSANPVITTLTSGAYVRPSSLGFPAIKRFLEILEVELNTVSI